MFHIHIILVSGFYRLEALTGKANDIKNFKAVITDDNVAPCLIKELVGAYLRATDRNTQV